MNKKYDLKELIPNIVIGFLAVLMTIMIFTFGSQIYDDLKSYHGRESDFFIYQIEDKRYGEMVVQTKRNRAIKDSAKQDLLEIYGVADYFEAASLYRAYQGQSDEEKAQFYAQKMEDAKGKMGDFSYLVTEINEILKID